MINSNMHVVMMTAGYKPAYKIGGPIQSVSAVAERLVKMGHRVSVLCTTNNMDEDLLVSTGQATDVDGVSVYYCSYSKTGLCRGIPSLLHSKQMKAVAEELCPTADVLHSQMPFIYPTRLADSMARRFGVPLVYHQRGVFSPERLRHGFIKKRMYRVFVEDAIARRADAIVALTQSEASWYKAIGCRQRPWVIPNGIDITASQLADDTSPARGEFNNYLLFLSRIHRIKGPSLLADSFSIIAKEYPDLHLVYAGPDEDGLTAQILKQHAALRDRIHFIGVVSGGDKARLLKRAKAFCLPSEGEGFSMAILEALQAGCPVVITPQCYFDEVQSAGLGVIANRTAIAFADGIRCALRMPRLNSVAIWRDFISRYSWDCIAQQTLDMYQALLSRRRGNEPRVTPAFDIKSAG